MADLQKLHTFVDWMLEQSDAIFIKKIPILREWLCQKKKIHKLQEKLLNHKNALSGVHYGLKESLARTLLRKKLSVVYGIGGCSTIFFSNETNDLNLNDM